MDQKIPALSRLGLRMDCLQALDVETFLACIVVRFSYFSHRTRHGDLGVSVIPSTSAGDHLKFLPRASARSYWLRKADHHRAVSESMGGRAAC